MALTTRRAPDSTDDFTVVLNGWMRVGRIYKGHHLTRPWLWFINSDPFVYRFLANGNADTFEEAKTKLAAHLRAGFKREGINEDDV